jgi:hypothetical protein
MSKAHPNQSTDYKEAMEKRKIRAPLRELHK